MRSPAAYQALKDFGILQLPCRSTLQSYIGAFLHPPGASSACLTHQVAQYVLFKEKTKSEGKREPRSDGALIFDEVKVVQRLMWNSKSQRLIGLAMTSDDQASLLDIYQFLNEDGAGTLQTSYILQFLWRDLTSSFDIVGPYYTSDKSLESKFVLACVYETIKLFHMHGLKTTVLVCDGASSNLAVVKATHGHSGVYRSIPSIILMLILLLFISTEPDSQDQDPFEIKPWMINPFDPPSPIFWIICPTHQVYSIQLINVFCNNIIVEEYDKCSVVFKN